MNLSAIDPALLERINRIIGGVWWRGGALVIAIGGSGLASVIRAARGKE